MLFALKVGLRYFRNGGSQTALTIASVAFGVTVYIFITTLIFGLQQGLIRRTIGSTSHITVEPLEEVARVLPSQDGKNVASVQPFNEREPRLRGWQGLLPALDSIEGVTAVSPVATGPGFAIRGGQARPITLLGIQEDRGAQIFDLRAAMRQGALDLGGQGCAIGIELARLLGLEVGDKVRVVSSKNIEQIFTVRGIFDAGNINVNERSFYINLNASQRLNDMVGDISRIEMQVVSPFETDEIVAQTEVVSQLKVSDWKRDNGELLGALQSQNNTTAIIRFFVMILVATGVASVLIVSVLQRSREIGILKSMGASTWTLQRVFIVLGALVGVSGALTGAGLGGSLVLFLASLPGTNPVRPGFALPIDFQLRFVVEAFAVAALIGALAAILPARRAALMNPVDVIRQG